MIWIFPRSWVHKIYLENDSHRSLFSICFPWATSWNISYISQKSERWKIAFFDFLFPRRLFIAYEKCLNEEHRRKNSLSYLICKRFYIENVKLFCIRSKIRKKFSETYHTMSNASNSILPSIHLSFHSKEFRILIQMSSNLIQREGRTLY